MSAQESRQTAMAAGNCAMFVRAGASERVGESPINICCHPSLRSGPDVATPVGLMDKIGTACQELRELNENVHCRGQ
jgi:hypothetical protein